MMQLNPWIPVNDCLKTCDIILVVAVLDNGSYIQCEMYMELILIATHFDYNLFNIPLIILIVKYSKAE